MYVLHKNIASSSSWDACRLGLRLFRLSGIVTRESYDLDWGCNGKTNVWMLDVRIDVSRGILNVFYTNDQKSPYLMLWSLAPLAMLL